MNNYLRGYVETTYDKLVKTFGEPTYRDGDKTTVEWRLTRFDSKTGRRIEVTIYDYKTSFTPMNLYNWHVGGTSDQNPEIVKTELAKVA